MAEEMRPLYLIAGTDEAKSTPPGRGCGRGPSARAAAALEVFEPARGEGMPDHEALLAAIPAMSLMQIAALPARRRGRALARPPARAGRRGAGRAAARPDPGPDRPRQAAGEAGQSGQGGKGRDARVRGAEGAGDAARLWSPTRSGSDSASTRHARGAGRADGRQPGAPRSTSSSAGALGGEGGRSSAADLGWMIADTSEAAVWSLSDALIETTPPRRCGSASA